MEEETYDKYVCKLRVYAKKFIEEKYGDRGLVFDIPIKFNGRLKSVLMRYRHSKKKPSLKKPCDIDVIEVSKELVRYSDDNVVLDVMRHELTHFALHRLGIKGYKDGDNEFEEELVRSDSKSTMTISLNRIRYIHKCGCIGEIVYDKVLSEKEYYCRSCGKRIFYTGEKIIPNTVRRFH